MKLERLAANQTPVVLCSATSVVDAHEPVRLLHRYDVNASHPRPSLLHAFSTLHDCSMIL